MTAELDAKYMEEVSLRLPHLLLRGAVRPEGLAVKRGHYCRCCDLSVSCAESTASRAPRRVSFRP